MKNIYIKYNFILCDEKNIINQSGSSLLFHNILAFTRITKSFQVKRVIFE